MKNPILNTIGTALLVAAIPMVGCASTPEPAAAAASTDAKAGEGSCGGEKKAGEGSCGEGSCGGKR